jgi:hypothetical protein
MAKPKKILITAIGAPKKKYNEISWNESPKPVETPFSFIVVITSIILCKKAKNEKLPYPS